MKSILSELYEGKIFPAEQYSPRSEEYRKIHQEHYQHYDDFIETLIGDPLAAPTTVPGIVYINIGIPLH